MLLAAVSGLHQGSIHCSRPWWSTGAYLQTESAWGNCDIAIISRSWKVCRKNVADIPSLSGHYSARCVDTLGVGSASG